MHCEESYKPHVFQIWVNYVYCKKPIIIPYFSTGEKDFNRGERLNPNLPREKTVVFLK